MKKKYLAPAIEVAQTAIAHNLLLSTSTETKADGSDGEVNEESDVTNSSNGVNVWGEEW